MLRAHVAITARRRPALESLLAHRSDDDVFWGRLVYLLDELTSEQRRVGLVAPEAEILGAADLDALIDEMRKG